MTKKLTATSCRSKEIMRWDAICHYGSYGYEDGLLEIYGELVTEDDDDSVVGYLTAADVVKRVEAWLKRGKNNEQSDWKIERKEE